MHRIVESIEERTVNPFFLQYRRREQGKHVRRLETSTAAAVENSRASAHARWEVHMSASVFCLLHRTAREAYRSIIQRPGKKGDVDVCFVKK
jgi:hypothetical protein